MLRSGVRIGYTPEVLNSDVADIAVGLTISVLRNFNKNSKYVIPFSMKMFNICTRL